MKNFLASTILVFSLLLTSAQSIFQHTITNSGYTHIFAPTALPSTVLLVLSTNLTLSNDINVYTTGGTFPAPGVRVTYMIDGTSNVNLNGHHCYIEGTDIAPEQLRGQLSVEFVSNGADWSQPNITASADSSSGVQNFNGSFIMSSSIPTSSLVNGSSAELVLANSSGVFTPTALTGNIALTATGVATVKYHAITDTMVSISASIARNKLAIATAGYVCVNDGAGQLSQEATLNPSRGGLGANVSGSTGFVTFSSGSSTVGAITDSKTFNISFDSSAVADFRSDNKVKMPCAGTLTGIYAYATTAFSATDAGTIIAKNAAGTTMGTGTITFGASDARGTAYSVTPSTNNTFSAGDILYFTNSKHTPGGNAIITITFTRSN